MLRCIVINLIFQLYIARQWKNCALCIELDSVKKETNMVCFFIDIQCACYSYIIRITGTFNMDKSSASDTITVKYMFALPFMEQIH